eukprot:35123-Eustigmatos_ZCMA.PRE.1
MQSKSVQSSRPRCLEKNGFECAIVKLLYCGTCLGGCDGPKASAVKGEEHILPSDPHTKPLLTSTRPQTT